MPTTSSPSRLEPRALALAALALMAGCTVPDFDLSGKACDETHACVDGYRCEEGVCVKGTAPTAEGEDAGADAANVDADAAVTPDAAVAADASIAPDAASVPPDASTLPPDAAVIAPDAAVIALDAATVAPDAAVIDPDAAVIPADAATLPPDAAFVAPDAAFIPPDASVLPPDAGCASQTEVNCGDGRDDDCDGLVDCADPDCVAKACGSGVCRTKTGSAPVCCADADHDGVDDRKCGGLDCDDGDSNTNPGALEQCNGRDDDCDGTVDQSDQRDLGVSTGLLAAASRRTGGFAVFLSTTTGYRVDLLDARGVFVKTALTGSRVPYDAALARAGDTFMLLVMGVPDTSMSPPTAEVDCLTFTETSTAAAQTWFGKPLLGTQGHLVAVSALDGAAPQLMFAAPGNKNVLIAGPTATLSCPSLLSGKALDATAVAIAPSSNQAFYVSSVGDLRLVNLATMNASSQEKAQNLPASPLIVNASTPFLGWLATPPGSPQNVQYKQTAGAMSLGAAQAVTVADTISGPRLLAIASSAGAYSAELLLGTTRRTVASPASTVEPALTADAAGARLLAVWFDDATGHALARTTCP